MVPDDKLAALTARFGVSGVCNNGILIVDDEPLNLRVLRSFLEDKYRIYEANSGEAALAIAREAALDVVITDQRMPGMTGVELLIRLRALKPDVAGIVLTGFADPGALESAINSAQVFRFLKKPFHPDDIHEAVTQATSSVAQHRPSKSWSACWPTGPTS